MRVDDNTLRDLEVRGTAVGLSLLDALDRTRTRPGRDALARRLAHPLDSTAAIRGVQDALRYITATRDAFDPLPDQDRLLALRRYLDSRFMTLTNVAGPAVTFESLWTRLAYRDLYHEARHGVRLVHEFLADLHDFVSRIRDAPGPLADIVARIRETAIVPPIRALAAPLHRFCLPRTTLLLDHGARDRGRVALLRILDLLAEIDALVSMSDCTAEKGFAFPVIHEEGTGLEIDGLYHPFLDQPVANALCLGDDARLLFITGPNMAGKTTWLKACGIAVLLAHTGMGIPAVRARMGILDRMITAIRTEDSLRDGVSYFQAEARRVRDMARPLADGMRCLIIADELFRGTNVRDACDASLTVLRTLAAAPRGCAIVASHLTEVADALASTPGIRLMRFEADLTDDCLSFDYRLRDGVSDQRLGMLVLRREGVLDALDRIRDTPDEPAPPTA